MSINFRYDVIGSWLLTDASKVNITSIAVIVNITAVSKCSFSKYTAILKSCLIIHLWKKVFLCLKPVQLPVFQRKANKFVKYALILCA